MKPGNACITSIVCIPLWFFEHLCRATSNFYLGKPLQESNMPEDLPTNWHAHKWPHNTPIDLFWRMKQLQFTHTLSLSLTSRKCKECRSTPRPWMWKKSLRRQFLKCLAIGLERTNAVESKRKYYRIRVRVCAIISLTQEARENASQANWKSEIKRAIGRSTKPKRHEIWTDNHNQ